MREPPDGFGWVVLAVCMVAIGVAMATGCVAPAAGGVPTMDFIHHGQPQCAIYMPSKQGSDGSVSVLFRKGPCPPVVVDDGAKK